MSDQWAELKELFHEALSLPAEGRASLIDSLRQRDAALADELATLLASHDEGAGFLASSPPKLVNSHMSGTQRRLQPGSRLGRYEVLEFVAAGGMGEVYRGRDVRLGRDVAIKTLPAGAVFHEWRARLEQEASAIAAISHPNICTIYEIAEDGDSLYLAMEYVDGVSLDKHVAQGPMASVDVLAIAVQLAAALEEAARNGVVHRDLKPANVMLTRRGQIKVLDFGLARQVAAGDLRLTRTGSVMGTLPYMSPEQVLGRTADQRSDLFSAGVMLYELLTGRRPFVGATDGELAAAILHGDVPPVSGPGAETALLSPIIAKLLQKDPAHRFQSAAELRAALADWHRAHRATRGAWRALAVTTAVLALSVLLVFAWRFAAHRGDDSVANQPGVVLLPSRVFGADDVAYLTEAVPATLSTYLAQLPGLDTRVPPTTAEVERVGGDIQRIAEAYAVDHCLMTSVTAQGNRLFLTAQLVNPATRQVSWSAEYEGTRDTYLDMVRDAARAVHRALVPEAYATVVVPTDRTPEAELALRRGEYHLRQYANLSRPEDRALARESLERALQLDPRLADAAADLAYLAVSTTLTGQASAGSVASEIEHWARRAISIDPRSGRGWAALAEAGLGLPTPNVLSLAEYALKGATFDPRCGNCQHSLGSVLTTATITLSTPAIFEARRIDPLSVVAANDSAMQLYVLNRTSEALQVLRDGLTIEPDSPILTTNEVGLLADLGRGDDARRRLAQAETLFRQQRISSVFFAAVQHAVAEIAGDFATADVALRELAASVSAPATTWESLNIQILTVPILGRSGRTEQALDLLERGVAAGTVVPFDWLATDPRLAALRRHPRYPAIAAAARTRFDAMREVLDRARRRGELPRYLMEPFDQLETAFPR